MRRLIVAVIAAAIAIVGVLPVTTASAVHDTGMFELDGTIADEPGANPQSPPWDWGSLFDSGGSRSVSPDLINGPLLASLFLNDTALPDDTYFASNKDTDPIGTGALTQWACLQQPNPIAKDQILNAYAALIQIPAGAPDNAGHTVLYFGVERASNNGDSFAGFWLLKNPNVGCTNTTVGGSGVFTGTHTDGDLLIVTNFTNGGGSQNVNVYEWSGGPSGGPTLLTSSNGGVCGTSSTDSDCSIANTVTQTSPWAPTSHVPNTFVEAGVDLTALSDACFATFLAETRSSQQISATLKDFAGGSSDGGKFNTCPQPGLATTAVTATGAGTVDPGTGARDVATLSAAGSRPAPTGTITFSLCAPSQVTSAGCPQSSGTQVGSPVTISAGSATSTPDVTGSSTPDDLAPGKYCWNASYTPDTASSSVYVPSFHTDPSSECFTVAAAKASPQIATVSSPSSGTAGVAISPVSDTATFSSTGASAPTGSVSFTLYSDAACTVAVPGVSGSGTITTTGGTSTATYSANWTATSAGTYYWLASYAGDASNNAFNTKCGDPNEQITVAKASPQITTVASPSSGTAGVAISPVSDTATFSSTGASAPTGSVSFTLYSDAACLTPAVPAASGSGAISTTSGGTTATYSTNWTPTTAGTYYWIASYGGDGSNNGFTTRCGDNNEQITVAKASPTSQITTQITCAQFAGGTSSTLSQLRYMLKGKTISQVSPGVFFYWVTVPAAGTYTITETANEASRPFLLQSGTAVFDNFDAATQTCTTVPSTIKQSTTSSPPGTVTVTFSSGTGPFYIELKYSSSNVVGETAPAPSTTVKYLFSTATVNNSTSEIDLVKK